GGGTRGHVRDPGEGRCFRCVLRLCGSGGGRRMRRTEDEEDEGNRAQVLSILSVSSRPSAPPLLTHLEQRGDRAPVGGRGGCDAEAPHGPLGELRSADALGRIEIEDPTFEDKGFASCL